MGYAEFQKWADRENLSREERDRMLRAAGDRGQEIAYMEEEDWEDLAKEIGVVLGTLRRLWRAVKGIFS